MLTGLVLGAIVIVCIFVHPVLLMFLLLSASCVAIFELVAVFKTRDLYTPTVPLLIGSCAMFLSCYFAGQLIEMVVYIITCFALLFYSGMAKSVADRHSGYQTGILVLTYIPLMLSFYVMMENLYQGPLKVLFVVVATVCSDTGGLIFGSIFGKNKMSSNISPNKTWEGFAGSMLLASVFSIVYSYFAFNEYFYNGKLWVVLLLGVLITAVGTFGDLIESTIKRECGVKDMSNILPGHGGILDRIDSLIIIAPFAYFYMSFLMG
ncbi:MAG: phosphatidate cytidylyltransferase [Candidatus Ancillula sp.]|nr:phosphatidate cytidylyltransferase [Candidatus Ancillula sp.]